MTQVDMRDPSRAENRILIFLKSECPLPLLTACIKKQCDCFSFGSFVTVAEVNISDVAFVRFAVERSIRESPWADAAECSSAHISAVCSKFRQLR